MANEEASGMIVTTLFSWALTHSNADRTKSICIGVE